MEKEPQLPPEIREQLTRLQQLQQTLQAVVTQKQQLELEKAEIEKASSELEKSTEGATVYKNVGNILIKSERQKLLDELKEKRELTDTRVTVLSKQEERTKTRLTELQQKLQGKLGTS